MNNDIVVFNAKKKIKNSIIFAVIVTIIIIIFCFKVAFMKFFLIFELFLIWDIISAYNSYIFLSKLREKVTSNSDEIVFSNNRNCVFTEQYIYFRIKRQMMCYHYSDINKIYKKICYTRRGMPEVLYINFNDNKTYEIFIYNDAFIDKNTEDIEKYLSNKNEKLLVDETIIDFGVVKF